MPGNGFIYTTMGERAAQFLFPPKTREELARRALETLAPRWVVNVEKRDNLELKTDLTIRGPLMCPFIEHFGEDMWIVSGFFSSRKMREVDEDFLWNSREIAHEQGVTQYPGQSRALPEDFDQQMQWIKDNPDKVYDDVRQSFKALSEARSA